jgi:hypothetical protein
LCDLRYIQNIASVIRFDCAALLPELQNSRLGHIWEIGCGLFVRTKHCPD